MSYCDVPPKPPVVLVAVLGSAVEYLLRVEEVVQVPPLLAHRRWPVRRLQTSMEKVLFLSRALVSMAMVRLQVPPPQQQ